MKEGPSDLRGSPPGRPNHSSGPKAARSAPDSSRASPDASRGAASPWLPRTRWGWRCALRRGAFPALRLHAPRPGSRERSEAPRGPRRPGAPQGAPCATNPAPKLANLAPGGARGVCPSQAGRRLGRGRWGTRGGEEPGRLGSRGVRAAPHLPGGSAAAASRASAGSGGSRSGSSSSSSSAGQSRRRAAPAGGSMAAGPQPGPRTRSRRESSPRAAQPTSGGSWSRPQLQHRRARGGGGEARRGGRGRAEGGGEREGARELGRREGGRRRARGRAGTAGASACGDPALLGAAAAAAAATARSPPRAVAAAVPGS